MMRWPPRHTPSERADGLVRLYGWLYPQGQHAIAIDEAYHDARSRGVAHVHVWINRGACPHAVESTAALVQAQQLDEQLLSLVEDDAAIATYRQRAMMARAAGEWPVRSSYAMALIRFVNAVADEQQTGLYAQSIFSIAERIGLPLWFVELRHAATHEEMPSLEVLRQASVAALGWLQARFWIPSVSRLQTSTQQDVPDDIIEGDAFQRILSEHADVIRTHLRAYKRLAKQIAKDVSLRGPKANELKRCQNQALQAAIRAGKALAHEAQNVKATEATSNVGYDADTLLAEVLMEPGFLIPEAKSKRSRPKDDELVAPLAAASRDTWLPLLSHLSEALFGFGAALLEALLDRIQSPGDDLSKQNGSYVNTLGSWLIDLYAMGQFSSQRKLRLGRSRYGEYDDEADSQENGDRTQYGLQQKVSLARSCLARPTPIALKIVRQLCVDDQALAERVEPLLELASPVSAGLSKGNALHIATKPSTDHLSASLDARHDDMDEMERAVLTMEAQLASLSKQGDGSASSTSEDGTGKRQIFSGANEDAASRKRQKKLRNDERMARGKALCSLLPGWRMADSSDFKPTPLGCLANGLVPDLVLTADRA